MSACPLTCYAAGLRHLSDAACLVLAGRCGTAGITGPAVALALRMPDSTVLASYGRLIAAGLVRAKSRDTGAGRPNRYTIAPAGLELLQKTGAVTLPSQQSPLPL